MSKAAREAVASVIANHARRYNKPGRIQVVFFDRSDATVGSLNMSGRDLQRIEAKQLKSIQCEAAIKAIFNISGSSSTCQIIEKREEP